MLGQPEKPERICIVDQGGVIVQLRDRNRTWMKFDASERPRAEKLLRALMAGGRESLRIIPLIEQ